MVKEKQKVREVEYILYGEGEKVLAEGKCKARSGDYEWTDICEHAGINIDDVWSVSTVEDR